MAYRNSTSRRSFSATSSVGFLKIVSSAAMREQRFWILFLTATISCRRVCQECILSEWSSTNFVFLINDRDGTQGGFERTECLRGLLCDVEENAAHPKCRICPASLRI